MEKLSLNNDASYISDVNQRDLVSLYFRHIFKRIHTYKFNFLGMITGKHRVGKSLTALSMSHVLDPTFIDNLEERVVYFPDDFMGALETIKRKRIIGGAIIWDEAGVGIPAREWYDMSNKSISYTLQVFGRYRPIVYFVTQDMGYIDSQARKLFHGFYEMNRMDNNYAIAKPFDVKYNKRSGKVYYVYPRYHLKNFDAYGTKLIIRKIKILKPFKEIEDRYDWHSKVFKDKIVAQMKERSEKYRSGEIEAKKMTVAEIIEALVKNKENQLYLSKRSKIDDIIFDKDSIRHEFGIPDSQARHIKKMAEMKANKVPEDERIVDEVPKEED
jgi:hypothetical protein